MFITKMASGMRTLAGALVRKGLQKDRIVEERLDFSKWTPPYKKAVVKKEKGNDMNKLIVFMAAAAVMNDMGVQDIELFLEELYIEEREERRVSRRAAIKRIKNKIVSKVEKTINKVMGKIRNLICVITKQTGDVVNTALVNKWTKELALASKEL
jgi:hypothetical protein